MIHLFFMIYIIILISEFLLKKTLFTPLYLVSVPIVIIALFNQLYMTKIGYFALSETFFFYLLLGCVVCFLSSITAHLVFLGKTKRKEKKHYTIMPESDKKILRLIFLVCSVCLFFYCIFLLFVQNVSLGGLKSYLQNGLAAHLIYFSILGAVFLYGSSKKMSFKDILIYTTSILVLVLYGTRGWVFITVLSGIYLRGYLYNIWPNKLLIVMSPVLAILFMVLSYYYRNFTGYVEASFAEILNHVLGYLVAGVQGANALFLSNIESEPYRNLVFNALNNIKAILLGGELVSNSTPYFFYTSRDGALSNVTTIFGTVFYGLGLAYGGIYLYFIFFAINIMFILRKQVTNIYFLTYFSCISSAISLGFFEYYLGLLFFVESIFILFFLFIIVKLFSLKFRWK